jgi:hypothetical protein
MSRRLRARYIIPKDAVKGFDAAKAGISPATD